MKLSDEGKLLLEKLEGFSLKPYKDIAGRWTISVGILLTNAEYQKYKDGITKEKAEELLSGVLVKFEDFLNKAVKVNLTQKQFDALFLLVYNIGEGAFLTSTLLKLLNQRKYMEASLQFARWNKYKDPKTNTLKVSPGLTRRRKIESSYFLGADLKQLEEMKLI